MVDLVQKDDVVTVLDGDPAASIIFICEHASNFIPDNYGDLGLDTEARESHIAWDPGAEPLTRMLAKAFRAPAVLGCVSRLVYDCNRPPDAPGAMPEKSEIFYIPGNQNLAAEDKQRRIEAVYYPFEQTVSETISSYENLSALVTIHSFTPTYQGRVRDVEIGILHDDDSRIADLMLDIASDYTQHKVYRNSPYGPEDGVTHTLQLHGLKNDLANVMIEVRNDLLQSETQQRKIAMELVAMISHAAQNVTNIDVKKAEAL